MRAVGELVLVVPQVVDEHLVVVADVVGQLERGGHWIAEGMKRHEKREEGREI